MYKGVQEEYDITYEDSKGKESKVVETEEPVSAYRIKYLFHKLEQTTDRLYFEDGNRDNAHCPPNGKKCLKTSGCGAMRPKAVTKPFSLRSQVLKLTTKIRSLKKVLQDCRQQIDLLLF